MRVHGVHGEGREVRKRSELWTLTGNTRLCALGGLWLVMFKTGGGKKSLSLEKATGARFPMPPGPINASPWVSDCPLVQWPWIHSPYYWRDANQGNSGKLLNLSMPPFPYWSNDAVDSTCTRLVPSRYSASVSSVRLRMTQLALIKKGLPSSSESTAAVCSGSTLGPLLHWEPRPQLALSLLPATSF